MRKIIHILQSDTVVRLGFFLSGISIVLAIILIAVFWRTLPDYVSLYPKLPWGYPRIGSKYELIYPFAVLCGVIAGSVALLPAIYDRATLLGRFLALTLGITAFFFFIFVFQTLRII